MFYFRRLASLYALLLLVAAGSAVAQVTSGDLDTAFSSSANAAVNAIAVQPDGKVIIGGAFTSVANQARGRLARLGTNGTVEAVATFANPELNGTVTGIALLPDGKIIAVGKFTTAGGASHNRIVRLNSNGTVDATFTVSLGSDAHAVVFTPQEKIWVGGNFGLVRIDATSGLVDTPAGADAVAGAVYALAVQNDGKILVAGKFGRVGSVARRNIARIDGTDGRVDTTFKADTDNSPDTDGSGTKSVASSAFALCVQPNGKVLVGGYFVKINGVARQYLARLNKDGSVDTAFNPKPNGAVYAFALDAAGDMVVGGEFTAIGGISRLCIAKLNASGQVTNEFLRGGGQISGQTFSKVAPWVFSLAQANDGKIYAGGYFTRMGGGECPRIARLFNGSSFGVGLHALLDEDPNADPQADSDTLDIRFVLTGVAPNMDMLFVEEITQTGMDPEVRTSLGTATRFVEAGVAVWKLRKTAQKRAVGDSIKIGLSGIQSQNAGGSSFYSYQGQVNIIATPKIEFTLVDSSTVNEIDAVSDGNTLPEPDTEVKVSLTVTGTIPFLISIPVVFGSNSGSEATKGSDYTTSLENLILTSATTAGTYDFTMFSLKDDELVEGNEIVTIKLGDAASTNFLPLGTNKQHVVTIPDDDFAPNITVQPNGGLFYAGSSTTLTVDYTTQGTGRVQWYKNNVPISGATSKTLALNNLQLGSAGTYFARVSNDKLRPLGGRAYTDTATEVLAVLRQTPGVHGVASGTNLTLNAVAAGTGLAYQWYSGGGANLISGATSPSYTFTAANGTYVCRVTLGATTLLAGEHLVGVINGAPVFPAMGAFQPGRVGVAFDQVIPIDPNLGLTPAFTSASGLPPGLTYNPNTMRVTGVPTRAGTFPVSMLARNALGTVTATRDILINPIPVTVLGSYSVRLGFGALADDIGGRVDFSLLSNGTITGNHVIKGKRRPFTGRATGNASAVYTAAIPLKPFEGDAAPSLLLSFDVPGANYVDAILQHSSGGWTGWGWRQTWSGGSATTRAGRHHYGSSITAGLLPAGSIAGVFNVSRTGVVTLSGQLPDATPLTGTAVLGPAGEVLIYRPLYKARGALLGGDVPPTIYPIGVPPALDGEFFWKKHDTTVLTPPTRDYATGFNGALSLTGSSYAAPASGTRVMNLSSASPNLRIEITDGGLGSPISVDAAVDSANKVQVITAPNTNQVSLVLEPKSGQFRGSFMDGTRKVAFRGVFWSTATSGSGMGWFLNGTGARESGRVTLTPLP